MYAGVEICHEVSQAFVVQLLVAFLNSLDVWCLKNRL